MAGLAPKLPLTPKRADGYQTLKTVKDVVRQNLKNLVLTSPGERIMDLDFGVGVRNYLFEFDTVMVREDIRNRVKEQVEKYLPFVELTSVFITSPTDSSERGSSAIDFDSGMESNAIRIRIVYNIIPLGTGDVLDLSL